MRRSGLTFAIVLVVFGLGLQPLSAQQPIFVLRRQIGRGTVLDAMWQPNGDNVLVSTVTGAWIYDERLADVGHIEEISFASYSPRGKYISGVGRDNVIRLYDPPTLRPIVILGRDYGAIKQLLWSPKGDALAALYADKTIRVWNVVSREIAFVAPTDAYYQIAWSQEGTYLAAAAEYLTAWQSQTWMKAYPRSTKTGLDSAEEESYRSDYTCAMTFTWTSDRYLYIDGFCADYDRSLQFDIAEGSFSEGAGYVDQSATALPAINEINCRTWCSPDHQSIVAENTIMTVNSAAATSEIKLGGEYARAAAWSADSTKVAVNQVYFYHVPGAPITDEMLGTIQIIDLVRGKVVQSFFAHVRAVSDIAWNTDQRRLLSRGVDGYLRTWDTLTGKMLGELSQHAQVLGDVNWGPRNLQLSTLGSDQRLRLWDVASGALVATFAAKPEAYSYLSRRQPLGSLIANGYGDDQEEFLTPKLDRGVEIWDLAQQPPALVSTIPIDDDVIDLQWTQSGTRLAILTRLGYLHIWDAATRNITQKTQIAVEGYFPIPAWDRDRGSALRMKWNWAEDALAVELAYRYDVVSGYAIVAASDLSLITWVKSIYTAVGGETFNSCLDFAWATNGDFLNAAWCSTHLSGNYYWNGAIVNRYSLNSNRMVSSIIGDDTGRLPVFIDGHEQYYNSWDYNSWVDYRFSPDGTLLSKCGYKRAYGTRVGQVLLLCPSVYEVMELGQVETPRVEQISKPPFTVGNITWSPDSKYFIVNRQVWDAQTGKVLATLDGATDKNFIITRQVWEAQTGKVRAALDSATDSTESSFIWSADSSWIAEVDRGVLYLWQRQ